MADGHDPLRTSVQTRSLVAPDGSELPGTAHLLIVAGDSARRVSLPPSGALIVGRASDADVTVPDSAVSRYHARITVRDGGVFVTDQGSHNGTKVNGVRITGDVRLVAGDAVGVGETSIVLAGAPGGARPRRLLDVGELVERLEQEVDRALRFERPLAVVAIAVDPAEAGRLASGVGGGLGQSDVAGWAEEGLLVLLLAELGGDELTMAVEAVVGAAPSARAGVAVCGRDGADAGTLLSAARAAAAGRARINAADAADARLAIGEREVIVADAAMERIYALLRRLAGGEIAVLITGETGVGKENAAYAVHAWSARARAPFVTLNCAAIQDTMVESELFGYRKGAFTGATVDKPGLLEAAAGGTVFLDEVGELSAAAQAKLLRALESKAITRLGDVQERKVDFRIVAATNRELEAEVTAGRFRQDLYFRLATATVALPPLRERRREIPLLARAFLGDGMRLSETALRALHLYGWPGNVRELRNAIEFASTAAGGDVVEPWHLPERVRDPADAAPIAQPAGAQFRPVAEELEELERRRMMEALDAAGGVQAQAARLIGMPRRTFTLKMKKYGLR